MRTVFFPRVWRPGTIRAVRLLAVLAVASCTLAGVEGVIGPTQARAQSAGLDEYRFPAGSSGPDPGAGSGGTTSTPARAVELPGGYPVTTPVLVLGAVLVAGLALRLVLAARQRARAS